LQYVAHLDVFLAAFDTDFFSAGLACGGTAAAVYSGGGGTAAVRPI
jgi:hypothetical protein